MELLNSWVRSSNPSTLPFAKTHYCLMATLDLFEISGCKGWRNGIWRGKVKEQGNIFYHLTYDPFSFHWENLHSCQQPQLRRQNYGDQSVPQALTALQRWAVKAVLKHLARPQGPAFPGTGWLNAGGLQAAVLSTCHILKLVLKHPLMFYLSHQNN